MHLRLRLSLPRDARFVGMLRHVAGCVFQDIGAPSTASEDIQLALTEACANAIRHAVGSAEYSVGLSIDAEGCEIEVMDLGPGFELPSDGEADGLEADADTETGRGVLLMRALVDDLEFTRHDTGMRVVLRKSWPEVGLALATQEREARTESGAVSAGRRGGPAGPR